MKTKELIRFLGDNRSRIDLWEDVIDEIIERLEELEELKKTVELYRKYVRPSRA